MLKLSHFPNKFVFKNTKKSCLCKQNVFDESSLRRVCIQRKLIRYTTTLGARGIFFPFSFARTVSGEAATTSHNVASEKKIPRRPASRFRPFVAPLAKNKNLWHPAVVYQGKAGKFYLATNLSDELTFITLLRFFLSGFDLEFYLTRIYVFYFLFYLFVTT